MQRGLWVQSHGGYMHDSLCQRNGPPLPFAFLLSIVNNSIKVVEQAEESQCQRALILTPGLMPLNFQFQLMLSSASLLSSNPCQNSGLQITICSTDSCHLLLSVTVLSQQWSTSNLIPALLVSESWMWSSGLLLPPSRHLGRKEVLAGNLSLCLGVGQRFHLKNAYHDQALSRARLYNISPWAR